MMTSNSGDTLTCTPIGRLETPFDDASGPIQPGGARGALGRAVLDPEYAPALADLDGFSHLVLLYHFDRTGAYRPTVVPFLDDTPRGLFATRAPVRPNPIGISLVRLVAVKGNVLELADVDMLDGTPLIDIKPYVPRFDSPVAGDPVRCGWLEQAQDRAGDVQGDDRFKR